MNDESFLTLFCLAMFIALHIACMQIICYYLQFFVTVIIHGYQLHYADNDWIITKSEVSIVLTIKHFDGFCTDVFGVQWSDKKTSVAPNVLM